MFKQPTIQEKSSSKFTPIPSSSGGFARGSSHKTPPLEVSQGPIALGVGFFVRNWNPCDDSRLSARSNAIEFYHHAFPPTVVADTDAMANVSLSHNMPYTFGKDMLYLVARSRCIQHLNELE